MHKVSPQRGYRCRCQAVSYYFPLMRYGCLACNRWLEAFHPCNDATCTDCTNPPRTPREARADYPQCPRLEQRKQFQ